MKLQEKKMYNYYIQLIKLFDTINVHKNKNVITFDSFKSFITNASSFDVMRRLQLLTLSIVTNPNKNNSTLISSIFDVYY